MVHLYTIGQNISWIGEVCDTLKAISLTSLVDNHWHTAGLQENSSFLKAGIRSTPFSCSRGLQHCQAHLPLTVLLVDYCKARSLIINQSSHLGMHKQTNAFWSIPRAQMFFYYLKICKRSAESENYEAFVLSLPLSYNHHQLWQWLSVASGISSEEHPWECSFWHKANALHCAIISTLDWVDLLQALIIYCV